MFGKNEVTKSFRDPTGKLLVSEIFYTIQGEGPDAGTPAVFLRLAKCNLRCYFCDTEFEKGDPMTARMAFDRIRELSGKLSQCSLVVITGGEPLLQNIVPLVELVTKAAMRVSVETAGTVYYTDLYHHFNLGGDDRARVQRNKIICSPKTRGISKGIASITYAWKYIVRVGGVADDDGLPIESTQTPGEQHRIYRPPYPGYFTPRVYLQPMDEQDPEKSQANARLAAELCMKHGYHLSLQMHKIVGLP